MPFTWKILGVTDQRIVAAGFADTYHELCTDIARNLEYTLDRLFGLPAEFTVIIGHDTEQLRKAGQIG